jgi:hypothetical protein
MEHSIFIELNLEEDTVAEGGYAKQVGNDTTIPKSAFVKV